MPPGERIGKKATESGRRPIIGSMSTRPIPPRIPIRLPYPQFYPPDAGELDWPRSQLLHVAAVARHTPRTELQLQRSYQSGRSLGLPIYSELAGSGPARCQETVSCASLRAGGHFSRDEKRRPCNSSRRNRRSGQSFYPDRARPAVYCAHEPGRGRGNGEDIHKLISLEEELARLEQASAERV